ARRRRSQARRLPLRLSPTAVYLSSEVTNPRRRHLSPAAPLVVLGAGVVCRFGRGAGPALRIGAMALLTLSQVVDEVTALQQRGKWVVFTNGVFDLLHPGHLRYLQAARRLGDCLIVGLNSDRSVRSNKGEGRPIIPERERAEVLSALDCVDAVVLF